MKKITKVIFGIIIVILLSLGVFFLYQKFSNQTKTLARYLPENTQYYLEIDLSDKNFRANLDKNEDLKKYFFDYLINKGISKYILELDKNSIIGLAGVKLFEQEEKVWLIENKNISKIETLLPAGYYFSIIDEEIGALSNSFDLIRVLKEKATKIETEGLTSKHINLLNYPVHGFVADDYLLSSSWLKKDNQTPIFSVISDLNPSDKILFGFNLGLDSVFFEIDVGELNTQDLAVDELFNYIPKLKHVISVNSINLNNFLDILFNITTQIAKPPNSDISMTEYVAKKFNFSWYELRKTLDRPVLLVMSGKKSKLEPNDFLDLSQFNYALVIHDPNQDCQNKIINVYKNVLAFQYPAVSIKKLPDQSEVTELIADPENITFPSQQIELGQDQKVNIYYFVKDQHNLFFSRVHQQFLLSNSQELIEEIIKSYQADKNLVIDDLLNQCSLSTKHQVFLFNPNLVESKFLNLFTQGLFNLDKQGVKGCWKIR